jgi:hypothetical protein
MVRMREEEGEREGICLDLERIRSSIIGSPQISRNLME